MRRLVSLASAISAATAVVLGPLETPAPLAGLFPRQGAVSSLASASGTVSSFLSRTYAYYSADETDGVTLWAPIIYASETFTWTSSGDFFRGCSSTFYATIGTSVRADTECPMFTTCSMGYLVAPSTSIFCVQQGYSCYTELLYSEYGATTEPLSWLYCGTSLANASNTAYYRTKPPDQVPTTEPVSSTRSRPGFTTSSPDPGSSPGPPTPDPTPSPPEPNPAPSKSNNTGAIAGGVVGGVAVIAIAAVAIFYILRRNRKPAQAGEPPANVPVYQPEKPGGPAPGYDQHASAPEYNPHASTVYSVGSGHTSPTVQSPVPMYSEPWNPSHGRNELQA